MWRNEYWVRLVFLLVFFFLIAQVLWWMIFQRNLIQQNLQFAEQSFFREAVVVQQLLTLSGTTTKEVTGLTRQLQEQFPHLEFEGSEVRVNAHRLADFRKQQLGYLRMLSFEGPFFLFVTLLGLWIIARSFRYEQELKRRQQNFLLSTTHEFRTPIGTLRLILDTLKVREVTPEKRVSYLLSMSQEITRLEDLSERLLATARLEQGLMSLQSSRQDISLALAEKLRVLSPTLEARGATLHFESCEQALWVEIDSEAFLLVISNVLENALKYSPDEKPIWVRVLPSDGYAVVEIEDRGIGIAKEEQSAIFEPFYRAGNELTRETKGVGLGLYLVRSLMQLMNGSVTYQALEKGSLFRLRFPLAERTRA
jgi:signal transduction histidine kinase